MSKPATERRRHIQWVLWGLIGAGLCVAGAASAAEEEAPVKKVDHWTGRLRTSYDYKSLGNYSDSDIYGYWSVRGKKFVDEHLDVYTSGRVHYDEDGTSTSQSDDLFVSSEDVSRDPEVRLLQLYADIHDKKKMLTLRAGRQYVDVADYIQMDGAQVMITENKRIGGRVFAGHPVSYYSSVSGDMFAGASLVGRPWKGNRTRLTFARYHDDSVGDADNHVFLNSWQYLDESLRVRGSLSVMNEEFRMGGVDAYYSSPLQVNDLVLGVRRWGTYDASTRVYSPLYEILGEQEEYTYLYARFTRELLPWLFVAPGAKFRLADTQNAQNRDYQQFDLTFILDPKNAWDASISGEYWDVTDGDRFMGVSGEVRYKHGKTWEVSVGAAYLDYQYTTYTDFSYTTVGGDLVLTADGTRIEVSPDAFTYYMSAKWRVTKALTFRVNGELEDDSLEDDLGYRVRTSLEVKL